jgi:hypothetical protein
MKLLALIFTLAALTGCGHAKILGKDCKQVGERVFECESLE